MSNCKICEQQIQPFLEFGKMPRANAYLDKDGFANEQFFELGVGFCEQCKLVQLLNTIPPEKMFHDDYAFLSSTSRYMEQHFASLAEDIIATHINDPASAFVVEIGSNDGIMLQHFAKHQINHLGIEPSKNVADIAISKGLTIWNDFFAESTAKQVCHEYGQADIICAANVIGHIEDLRSVGQGLDLLLKPDGLFIFEHPYLVDNIQKNAFDQIYDEHIYYFSLLSVQAIFPRYGLEVVDVKWQSVHGGSMRYTLARQGVHPVATAVSERLAREQQLGLDQLSIYQEFALQAQQIKRELLELLTTLKQAGHRIVGYGATAKSSTVLNFCGIGPDTIDYISDVTPCKQGRFSPGMHIPIKPYSDFCNDDHQYTLLFAWNHTEEILTKEQTYNQRGGRWIVFVPHVNVFDML